MKIRLKLLSLLILSIGSVLISLFLYTVTVRNTLRFEREKDLLQDLKISILSARFESLNLLQSANIETQWNLFSERIDAMKEQYGRIAEISYIPSLDYDLNRALQSVLMLEKLADHQYDNLRGNYRLFINYVKGQGIIADPYFSYGDAVKDLSSIRDDGNLLYYSVKFTGSVDQFDSILGSSMKLLDTRFNYIDESVSAINGRTMGVSLAVSFLVLALAVSFTMFFAHGLTRDAQKIVATLQTLGDDQDRVSFSIGRKDEIGILAEELSEVIHNLFAARNRIMQSDRLDSLNHLLIGLSHEINTPLGVCVTSASYLKTETGKLPEERGDQKKRIESSVDLINSSLGKIVRLVNSFRELSTSDKGREERVNLSEYLKQLIENYTTIRRFREVEIAFRGEDRLFCTINLSIFNEIMIQLFNNALKHGLSPNRNLLVSIDLSRSERGIRLVFSDDGRGMAKEATERIFNPFYTTSRTEGNTGLGLYRVRNLVTNRLGGTITCNSAPGEGTSFSITWPDGDV